MAVLYVLCGCYPAKHLYIDFRESARILIGLACDRPLVDAVETISKTVCGSTLTHMSHGYHLLSTNVTHLVVIPYHKQLCLRSTQLICQQLPNLSDTAGRWTALLSPRAFGWIWPFLFLTGVVECGYNTDGFSRLWNVPWFNATASVHWCVIAVIEGVEVENVDLKDCRDGKLARDRSFYTVQWLWMSGLWPAKRGLSRISVSGGR